MRNSTTIPIPPSANNLWRVVRRRKGGKQFVVKSRPYEAWLPEAVLRLRTGLSKPALPCGVGIVIFGGMGWNKTRDIDNCIKGIIDAIKTAGLIPDDSWDIVREVRIRYEDGDGSRAHCVAGFLDEESK